MMPTMTPKSPRALPKISTIRILTNIEDSCASARAALVPEIPTVIPQIRLERPTVSPAEKIA